MWNFMRAGKQNKKNMHLDQEKEHLTLKMCFTMELSIPNKYNAYVRPKD